MAIGVSAAAQTETVPSCAQPGPDGVRSTSFRSTVDNEDGVPISKRVPSANVDPRMRDLASTIQCECTAHRESVHSMCDGDS